MNKVYLLIGGNLGNRQSKLQQAASLIQRSCGTITARSSIFETAAWGKTDQPAFLNQALALDTLLDAGSLLQHILQIEHEMGRHREERFGPREIDIDILFFNKEIISLPGLKIPHPQIQNRRFVLEPMNELAANWNHPLLNKTIHQLLQECADPLSVKKMCVP